LDISILFTYISLKRPFGLPAILSKMGCFRNTLQKNNIVQTINWKNLTVRNFLMEWRLYIIFTVCRVLPARMKCVYWLISVQISLCSQDGLERSVLFSFSQRKGNRVLVQIPFKFNLKWTWSYDHCQSVSVN